MTDTISTTTDLAEPSPASSSQRHIIYTVLQGQLKQKSLLLALEMHPASKCLVVCENIDDVELSKKYLGRFGFIDVEVTHELALENLSSHFDVVVNDTVVSGSDKYLARSKAGKSHSTVITLISEDQTNLVNFLQTSLPFTLEYASFASEQDILVLQAERIAKDLVARSVDVELGQYTPIAEHLLKLPDVTKVMGYLIRQFYLQFVEPKAPSMPRESRSSFSRHKDRDGRRDRRNFDRDDRQRRSEHPGRHEPREYHENHDRPARREQPQEKQQDTQQDFGSKQIYVTLGRQDGFEDVTSLAQYIGRISGVDFGHFTGEGHVRDRSSHFEVDSEVVDAITKAINNRTRDGLPSAQNNEAPITCEVARPRSRRR